MPPRSRGVAAHSAERHEARRVCLGQTSRMARYVAKATDTSGAWRTLRRWMAIGGGCLVGLGIGGGLYTVLGYVHPKPATPPAHVEDLVGWGLGFGLGLGLLVAAAIRA